METLLPIALKSLVVAGGALLLLWIMRHRSAADRSLIAHLGLAAVLLLPLGSLLPPLGIEGPAFLAQDALPTLPEPNAATSIPAAPLANSEMTPGSSTTDAVGGIDLALLLYALPAVLLAGLTLAALFRLIMLKSRADVLIAPEWLTALAEAQQRMGFKHGTALLTSNELPSPISWGVVRPVILLNQESAGAHGQAEAIIAHELAHVAHLDWAKLLLARAVSALFWFNPLVWMLAREGHQLREEAADDAVLAANIEDTDYAQLLVGVARHECRGLLIGAHGVAPGKDSLARRVRRVLDGALERAPGGWRWSSAAAIFAAGMAVPLAALTVVPQPAAQPLQASAAQPPVFLSPPAPPSLSTKLATIDLPTTQPQSQAAPARPPSAPTSTMAPSSPTMIATKSGHALLRGPNGMTLIAGADGTATVMAHGRSIATASANGVTAEASTDSRINRAITRRALGLDSAYERSIRQAFPGVRIGERELIELKALGVTGEYVRGMAAAGYRGLDVRSVVELRALQITPSDVVRARKAVGRLPTPSEMVEMRAVGVEPEDLDPGG